MQEDGEFGFTIDFKKGSGNPRRVFDAASALIDAFESFDKAVLVSIGGKIEPTMVLDDVQTGSMKVWLRNMLHAIDYEALKSGDVKKIVGGFLLGAKYKALEFLKDETGAKKGLEILKSDLSALAIATDVRQLPDYAPIHEGRLIAALDKIQNAKAELEDGDRLIVNLDKSDYEVDIGSTWLPSEALKTEPSESHRRVGGTVRVQRRRGVCAALWGILVRGAPLRRRCWKSACVAAPRARRRASGAHSW